MGLKNFSNKCQTVIADNPKAVLCSIVGTAGVAGIWGGHKVWVYYHKKKADTKSSLFNTIEEGEVEMRKKRNATECNIMEAAAKTSCKIMVQATSVAPEMKNLQTDFRTMRDEVQTMNKEMKTMMEELKNLKKATSSDTSSPSDGNADIDCHGCSSEDLFNRIKEDDMKWVVDGFMLAGQVNLLVAGGGKGKSNMLTQIALAVDKGARPEFMPPESHPSAKLQVKYYRLEDFNGELKGKYGDGAILKSSGIEWFLPEQLPGKDLTGFLTHLKTLAAKLTVDTVIFIDPATKLDGYKHSGFIKGVEEAMEIATSHNIALTLVASIHADEIEDWKFFSLNCIKGGDQALQKGGSVSVLRQERSGKDYRFLQCLKDPKGCPTPLEGNVLVMKKVEVIIDTRNKNVCFQFDSIKSEAQARPEKPKVQGSETVSAAENVRKAPHLKVTPEIEQKIGDMLAKGMKPAKIAKVVHLSEKTIRRYKKNKK